MSDSDDDPKLIFSKKSGAYMVHGVRLEVNILCVDPRAYTILSDNDSYVNNIS